MSPVATDDFHLPTTTSSYAATPSLLRPIPDPKLYGVSSKNGFLPSEPPLQRLPDPYYAPWEQLATRIPALILSQRFRGEVDRLPILSTERLITEADWQRACCILGFATHSYIWAGDRPAGVRELSAVGVAIRLTPSLREYHRRSLFPS